MTTYGYNAANQLLSESTDGVATAYSFDANGNCVQKSVGGGSPETWTYGFDYHNRLVSTVSTTGVSASYVFDYDVRRLSKTVNGATECFVYDGDDIIADYAGGPGGLPGALTASYVNSVTIDSKLMRIDGPGSPTPGVLHYYMYDALGSVRNVVDAAGAVENEYVQNAWGEDVPGAGQQTLTDRYQFTGRELDPELGLMHYRNRCYMPSAGRFMQKDPSGMPDGPNRYIYVCNNPVNSVDPWGLLDEETTESLKTLSKHHPSEAARTSAQNILEWEEKKYKQELFEKGEKGGQQSRLSSSDWWKVLDNESKKLQDTMGGGAPNVYTDQAKFQEHTKAWLFTSILKGDIYGLSSERVLDLQTEAQKKVYGRWAGLETAGEELCKCYMDMPIDMILGIVGAAGGGGLFSSLDEAQDARRAAKAAKTADKAADAAKTTKQFHKYSGRTVRDILKEKLGSIKNARLPKGTPPWEEIGKMTWDQVEEARKQGRVGFDTIHKLLTSGEYVK